MNRTVAGVVILIGVVASSSAQVSDQIIYREVKCRVIEQAGRPVANTEVVLRGLYRDALRVDLDDNDPERAARCHGWKFRTDKDGYFTARFGTFVQYEHELAAGTVEPGYGRFYFVVQKDGFAGGVSREILNLNSEELAQYRIVEAAAAYLSDQEGDEWESDPYLLADGTNVELITIELRCGIEVVGQIQDTADRPVANQDIDLFLDLHADSHTGHGNEIFCQTTTSDRQGHFHFDHVYPNTFYLELPDHSDGPPYWIKTRVRKRWIDSAEDEITPRGEDPNSDELETTIPIVIVVSRQPIYRYFGKVTDSDNRPVADAKVEVRCSLHNPERTYEDDHDYNWKTRTDRDGYYSIRVGSRFVNAIWVYAKGYDDRNSGVQEEIFAPGRYDFTLMRK